MAARRRPHKLTIEVLFDRSFAPAGKVEAQACIRRGRADVHSENCGVGVGTTAQQALRKALAALARGRLRGVAKSSKPGRRR